MIINLLTLSLPWSGTRRRTRRINWMLKVTMCWMNTNGKLRIGILFFYYSSVDICCRLSFSLLFISSPVQKLPNIGFDLFARHLLTSEKFRALQPEDRDLLLSIRWENMTEEEKNEYNIEAAKVWKKISKSVRLILINDCFI